MGDPHGAGGEACEANGASDGSPSLDGSPDRGGHEGDPSKYGGRGPPGGGGGPPGRTFVGGAHGCGAGTASRADPAPDPRADGPHRRGGDPGERQTARP